MVWSKGYTLAAVVSVSLLTDFTVANAVTMVNPGGVQAIGLFLSLALGTGLTGVFTWSVMRQSNGHAHEAAQMRRLAHRDRLTNVATRDFLFDRVAARPQQAGVVMMLDIDYFKQVNDTYGHLAGDAVIRGVATVLRHGCRREDIVCRFGGEEFLIFMPDSDHERGAVVAERLRMAVAETVTRYEGEALSVTVSVGVAFKTVRADIDQAIRDADDALFQAKRRGRDRAVLAWKDRPRGHATEACPMPSVAGRLPRSA